MDCLISFVLEKVGHLVVTVQPEQSECIRYMYKRKDVSLAANWFWKVTLLQSTSLCIQQLGRQDSVVLVVSPLVLLMVDQAHS